MSQWPMVSLGEVLIPKRPDVDVSAHAEYHFAGVYCFGKGVFRGVIKLGLDFAYRRLTTLTPGDFIYPKLMAWEGAFGVVPPECDGLVVSPEYPVFSADPSRLDPHYLGYHFSNPSVWPQVAGESTGTNVRRRRLHPDSFLRYKIPLPPLSEQQRIVAWIDAVTTRVAEAHSEADAALNRLDQLLMSAFREISAGAPMRPMGDIAPLTRRPVEVDPEAEYPGISARSFGRGTFHNPPLLGSDITWQKPYEVKAGDILVSNIKAWEGAIAVVNSGDDGRFGSHRYLTFSPIDGVVTPRFVCFYLLSPTGLYYVGEASPGSADRNRTTGSGAMQAIPVPVPRFERQLWFDQLFEKVDNAKQVIEQTRVERSAMLPAILNQVFNGEGDG